MKHTIEHSALDLRRAIAVVVVALVAAILLGSTTTPAQAVAQHSGYVAAIGNRAIGQTDPWGMASYFCTSYAAYRVNTAGTDWRSDGRYMAHQWDERARERGITVSGTPKKGAVAVWEGASWNGGAGHVAYVESVNSNGTANVSEYNFNVQHGYGTRNNVRAPEYIHFKAPSPPPPSMPFGNFDSIQRAPSGAIISGWAIDPNAGKGAIRVNTFGGTGNDVSTNPNREIIADDPRPDVGSRYPKYGSNHGYSGTIALGYRTHTVCSYAINRGPGSHKQIGCKTINISPHPFGDLNQVKPVPGGVEVTGWAIDPDTKSSIRVHLYGGSGAHGVGNPFLSLDTNVSRPDVEQQYGPYGDLHGYKAFFSLPAGEHKVCAYGINAPNTPGEHKQIGCREVYVPDYGNEYLLDNDFDGSHDLYTIFGQGTDEAIVGDWDGDGTDTLGVRRGNTYFLNNDFDEQPDISVVYGSSGDEVVVGDWDGNGTDTLGYRRGGQYYLSNDFDDDYEIHTSYGWSSDIVVTGDWNGDGIDTLGVRRGGTYYLNNNFDDTHDILTRYGWSSDEVVTGDWDGNGTDTLGVRRNNNEYYLNNNFDDSSHDLRTIYGSSTDQVVVGDWDGDGTDTLGIRSRQEVN